MIATATIFLVDDDHSVRVGVSRLLRALGWNVEAFADAATLLDRLPYWGPACALVDVSMPGMNGIELRRCMRKKAPAIPVVFLTGQTDVPMEAVQGGVEVLAKPVDADVLHAALRRALYRGDAGSPTARHLRVV